MSDVEPETVGEVPLQAPVGARNMVVPDTDGLYGIPGGVVSPDPAAPATPPAAVESAPVGRKREVGVRTDDGFLASVSLSEDEDEAPPSEPRLEPAAGARVDDQGEELLPSGAPVWRLSEMQMVDKYHRGELADISSSDDSDDEEDDIAVLGYVNDQNEFIPFTEVKKEDEGVKSEDEKSEDGRDVKQPSVPSPEPAAGADTRASSDSEDVVFVGVTLSDPETVATRHPHGFLEERLPPPHPACGEESDAAYPPLPHLGFESGLEDPEAVPDVQAALIEISDDDEEPFVTPIMGGDAMVDLLMSRSSLSGDSSWRASDVRDGIRKSCPSLTPEELSLLDGYDDSVVSTRTFNVNERVCFATGQSDEESIRDQDTGPGRVRWHKRDRYMYVRQRGHYTRYRRRVKPVFGPGNEGFQWKYEVESDDAGDVNQESFILPADVEIDPVSGLPIGKTSAKTLETERQEFAVKYEEEFTDSGTVAETGAGGVLVALKDQYRVVQPSNVPSSTTVDEDLLERFATEVNAEFVGRDAGIAVEFAFATLRRGMPYGFIGQVRDPGTCGECEGSLLLKPVKPVKAKEDIWQLLTKPTDSSAEPTDEELKALQSAVPDLCPFCNCLLHKCCAAAHFRSHVKGVLCCGLRRRDAEAAKKKKDLELVRTVKTGSRSDLEAKAQAPRRQRRSEAVSPQPCEPSLEPAAGAGAAYDPTRTPDPVLDPVASIYLDRPIVVNDEAELKRARKELRSTTSDEEKLPASMYCSWCGAKECRRSGENCRDLRKAELEVLAVDAIRDKLPQLVHDKLVEELLEREDYCKQRKTLKTRRYARRREANPVDLKAHLRTVTVPGYEHAARIVNWHGRNIGTKVLEQHKAVVTMANRGQQYAVGTRADSVVKDVCLQNLSKAVSAWKSSSLPIFRKCLEHLDAYWSKIGEKDFHTNGWAWSASVEIRLRFPSRLAEFEKAEREAREARADAADAAASTLEATGLEDEAPPSVPRLEPAAGAQVNGSSEARAVMQDAARQARQNWQTGDYMLKMDKVADGLYETSVWRVRQECRDKALKREQRFRAIYAKDGPHAQVCRQVLGQHGQGVSNLVRDENAKVNAELGVPSAPEEERKWLEGDAWDKACELWNRRIRVRTEKEQHDMDNLYKPGDWWCSKCWTVNGTEVSRCEGFIIHKGAAKDRKGQISKCAGSQAKSWGGYCRPIDVGPQGVTGIRTRWPEWRGKYQTSIKRKRAIAAGTHPTLSADAEAMAKAKKDLHDNRTQRLSNKREQFRAKVMEDSYKWECPHCYEEVSRDGETVKQDLFNESWRERCRRCSTKRPAPGGRGGVRWQCPNTGCNNYFYTFSDVVAVCPHCKRCRKYDDYSRNISGPPPPDYVPPGGGFSFKLRRKRGGKKKRTRETPQPSEPRHEPAAGAADSMDEYSSSEAEKDEQRKAARPKLLARGRRLQPGMAVIGLATLPMVVETVSVGNVAAVAPVGLMGLFCLLLSRSYETMDTVLTAAESTVTGVLTAVEDAGVNVIGAVSHETMRVIPLVFGVLVVLLLVAVHWLLGGRWRSNRERLKELGESPEGNASLALTDKIREKIKAPGFPTIPWLSSGLIARCVPNWNAAIELSNGGYVQPQDEDSSKPDILPFVVLSRKESGKRYSVRITRSAMGAQPRSMRDLIHCGCPGHLLSLSEDSDSLCMHCGAVLICCYPSVEKQLLTPKAAPMYVEAKFNDSLGYWVREPPPRVPRREPAAGAAQGSAKHRSSRSKSVGFEGRQLPKQALQPSVPSLEPAAGAVSFRRVSTTAPGAGSRCPRCHGIIGTTAFGETSCYCDEMEEMMRCQKCGELTCQCDFCEICRSTDCHCVTSVDRESSPFFRGYDSTAEEAAALLANGGKVRSFPPAKQAQKLACFMCSRAEDAITLTGFTFDLLVLCEALKAAAVRGVPVEVYVDKSHSMSGSTLAMMERLESLRSGGVEVYLTTGASGGIQHSKTLLVDGTWLLVGSTNWTNSSRSNHELSVCLHLTGEGRNAVREWKKYLVATSQLLTVDGIKTAKLIRADKGKARSASRARAKSSEQDQYATAKRWSIARNRSREKALRLAEAASTEASGAFSG